MNKLKLLGLVSAASVILAATAFAQAPVTKGIPWWQHTGHNIDGTGKTNDTGITFGSRGTASGGNFAGKTATFTNVVSLTNTVVILKTVTAVITNLSVQDLNALTNTVGTINATAFNILSGNLTNLTANSVVSLTNASTIYTVGGTPGKGGTVTNDSLNSGSALTNRQIFKDGILIYQTAL